MIRDMRYVHNVYLKEHKSKEPTMLAKYAHLQKKILKYKEIK